MVMERQEIYSRIEEILVEALGVDEDEISETSIISDDLGAESIDYLDITFRIEREFGITAPHYGPGIFPSYNGEDPSEYFRELPRPPLVSGRLTSKGVSVLRENYPHINLDKLSEEEPDLDEINSRITVKTLVDYVEKRVNS
ncbi:MAG: acyl carrier protein [Nanoarchaeota archaeon]|nr:acyl carrier protein [Nanoarchaeota archaeon]